MHKHNAAVSFRIWTIFGTESRRILQTGPRNLAKFTVENCGPYTLVQFRLDLPDLCLVTRGGT